MKIKYICFLFFVLLFTCSAVSAQEIHWNSYKEGMLKAKNNNKKIFLHFYADWCKYCVQMDKLVFKYPTVITYLNSNFVAIKVNSDKNRKLALDYNVRGLPASMFMESDGRLIGKRPGYIPQEDFLAILKSIKR